MSTSLKKLTSIALTIILLVSCVCVGTASSNAVTNGDYSEIFLRLNSNWGMDSPRFAAYFFVDDQTNKWADMTAVSGETDLYSVTVPSDAEWAGVIFCRMNPATTENIWDNRWNQTADLKFTEMTGNCFTIDDGLWGASGNGATGKWSTYSTASQGVEINGTTYNKGDIIQVTVKHQIDCIISGVSGFIKYDRSLLKLTDEFNDDKAFSDKLSQSGSFLINRDYNHETDGLGIAFSAINAGSGYDFTTEDVLAVARFEVIAESGNTSITHKLIEEYDMDFISQEGTTTYEVTLFSAAPTEPTEPTVPTYTVKIYTQESEIPDVYEIEEGGVAVANAPGVEGKKFCYWTDENGRIVTYSRSHGFYVFSDRTLKAVYADNEVEKLPTISITKTFSYTKNNKNYVAFDASRDVPKTYKVIEYGVLYGTSLSKFVNATEEEREENMQFNKERVYNCTFVKNSLRGTVRLNVNVANTDVAKNMSVFARGYMIVEKNGEQQTIYTPVVYGSYNNPVQ